MSRRVAHAFMRLFERTRALNHFVLFSLDLCIIKVAGCYEQRYCSSWILCIKDFVYSFSHDCMSRGYCLQHFNHILQVLIRQ